jgi:hypothetical protein
MIHQQSTGFAEQGSEDFRTVAGVFGVTFEMRSDYKTVSFPV